MYILNAFILSQLKSSVLREIWSQTKFYPWQVSRSPRHKFKLQSLKRENKWMNQINQHKFEQNENQTCLDKNSWKVLRKKVTRLVCQELMGRLKARDWKIQVTHRRFLATKNLPPSFALIIHFWQCYFSREGDFFIFWNMDKCFLLSKWHTAPIIYES